VSHGFALQSLIQRMHQAIVNRIAAGGEKIRQIAEPRRVETGLNGRVRPGYNQGKQQAVNA
jgi:hypothetical protein